MEYCENSSVQNIKHFVIASMHTGRFLVCVLCACVCMCVCWCVSVLVALEFVQNAL